VSGSLALESDVAAILTCEKLVTSPAWRHEKTFVKGCELLDILVASIWMQTLIYLPSSSWIQLLVLVRATCCNAFKCALTKLLTAVVQPDILIGGIKNTDTSLCSWINNEVFTKWRYFATIAYVSPTFSCFQLDCQYTELACWSSKC